jgi:hypothetical protein
MFHLAAYSANIDSANLTALTPLADTSILVDQANKQITVPELNKVIASYAIGAGVTIAQLSAPSMRRFLLYDISPIERNATPRNPLRICDQTNNPLSLVTNEYLQFLAAEDGAGATRVTGLVWLADRQPTPVGGDEMTVRATSSTTLVAYTWTACTLTLTQTLPAGLYSLVGLAASSAGAIAARVVFVGGRYRPGIVASTETGGMNWPMFRHGNFGEFGRFQHNLIPQIEMLSSSADTSEEFYLDLVKVG